MEENKEQVNNEEQQESNNENTNTIQNEKLEMEKVYQYVDLKIKGVLDKIMNLETPKNPDPVSVEDSKKEDTTNADKVIINKESKGVY